MGGRYFHNVEQSETDSHSLIKRIRETSVVLSDLDGLLVNSENFNQVFVHRTSKAWMRNTISRVVKSDLHLRKFLQVLISFITSERHPEWARHALVWLRFLLSNYPIPASTWYSLQPVMAPLRSHANEMAGLHDSYVRAALRGTAVEQWSTQTAMKNKETNRERLFYDAINGIPSTGFVFVDDSDEESSGKQSTRSGLPRQPTNTPDRGLGSHGTDSLTAIDETIEANDEDDNLLLGSDNEFDFMSEEDDGEEEEDPTWNDSDQDEDESEDQLDPIVTTPSDSDHGVFDVNDTASSSSRDVAPDEEDEDEDDNDADEGEEEDSEDADEGTSDEDGIELDDQQPGGNSNMESSDASSVVSETTSESDEETKFLLLGREIHKDSDEELQVASTTTPVKTLTTTDNHTPISSPQPKRSPGKANLTDSKSPSPKKRRCSASRT